MYYCQDRSPSSYPCSFQFSPHTQMCNCTYLLISSILFISVLFAETCYPGIFEPLKKISSNLSLSALNHLKIDKHHIRRLTQAADLKVLPVHLSKLKPKHELFALGATVTPSSIALDPTFYILLFHLKE